MAKSSNREVSQGEAEQLVRSIGHWHHRFEIAPGVITPGTYDPGFMLDKMELPKDLSGQRVLDVGPSDGFFSLNLRRRGAQVTAVDYRSKDRHGFGVMERISGLDFDYHQCNLYDLSEQEFGTFGIVLFLGVLYHLADIIKALSVLRSICTGRLFLETHCAVGYNPGVAVARYYRGSTLNDDFTNFWSPNPECLRDMLYDTAFDIDREETWGDRYFAACKINQEPARAYKMQVGYGVLA
jgi:tRNA (mo5U34)-methyltransferase